jgi:hypothetical protein
MVLDPLSAVGLAGNIIQFVEFACKLLFRSCEIYNSSSGLSEEALSTIAITRHLQELCLQLSGNSGSRVQEDETLRDLARRCKAVADKLLSATETLKAKEPRSKWESFYKSLEAIWKKDQIEALQNQLRDCRAQLMLHLEAMHV